MSQLPSNKPILSHFSCKKGLICAHFDWEILNSQISITKKLCIETVSIRNVTGPPWALLFDRDQRLH